MELRKPDLCTCAERKEETDQESFLNRNTNQDGWEKSKHGSDYNKCKWLKLRNRLSDWVKLKIKTVLHAKDIS